MDLLTIAVVVVAFVAAVVLYRFVNGSAIRAFSRLPVTAIASVTVPGVYRLSGVARAVEDAPVSQASGRPYLAQDLRIVPSDGSDSGSTRAAQQGVDFLLDDGTGTALIRADGSVIAIDRDFEAPQTTLDQVPWVDTLLRAGGYRNGSPTTCKIRLYEGVLQPGDQAGVIGYLEPTDAVGSATVVMRTNAGTRVMIRAEPGQPA
ncbi:hypothetical protein [Catellatospora sichuanensis]|uniref:hypothetical protein n=1 Tax=Catellatospora sichuanensis TaxID=1969805 RepID=UPI001182E9F0|nr:hypothetical protein [Catellatospora sichuanensis]